MGRNSIKYSKNIPSRRAVKKDELVIGAPKYQKRNEIFSQNMIF